MKGRKGKKKKGVENTHLSRLLLLLGPLPGRGRPVHLEGVVLVKLACGLLLFDSLHLIHLVERGKTAVPAAQTHAQLFVFFVLRGCGCGCVECAIV